jgi:hypothetical protein
MKTLHGCDWKILCFCENFLMKLESFEVKAVFVSNIKRDVIENEIFLPNLSVLDGCLLRKKHEILTRIIRNLD